MSLYLESLGESNELYEQHMLLVNVVIEACKQAGSYEVRISWNNCLSSAVTSTERQRQSIEDCDYHIELQYYMHTYKGGMGDPKTNGHNHKVGWADGGLWRVCPRRAHQQNKRSKRSSSTRLRPTTTASYS